MSAYFYLLKFNVFNKWRLGGLPARFWRPRPQFLGPRGSILEGSGTIFRDFPSLLAGNMQELLSYFKLKLRGSSWELQLPVPIHLTPTSNFNHEFPKGRWAAVSPPGGLQSAAHRRCAKRVGPEVNSSKVQLQMPNLITLSPGCLYTPL